MSEYEYPELLHLLKINCTVEEYRGLPGWVSTRWIHYEINTESKRNEEIYEPEQFRAVQIYDKFLPEYIYAHCPLCGTVCQEKIDTYYFHTVRFRFNMTIGHDWYWSSRGEKPCPHYLGVHDFFNAHDQLTPEGYISKHGEVPWVAGNLMPESLNARVVLHALPICEIVKDRFEPRYTIFILTYFCEDPVRILEDFYLFENAEMRRDDEYYPPYIVNGRSRLTERKGKLRNLQALASNGELGYLDYTKPDLPLVIGKGTELPQVYRKIKGRRKPFTYDKKNSSTWNWNRRIARKLGLI